jgi:hypothetical protein
MLRFRTALFSCLLLGLSGCALRTQSYSDLTTRTPLPAGDTLIIGFMGGRDSFRDRKVGVGRLADRLRERKLPGVQVETIENMRRGMAFKFVKRGLDRNQDGVLDLAERKAARIILYGQSFGGAAVVKFARTLHAIDVPVMLTVQVDSVGRTDEIIPPNVRRAANFYQRDGRFIRGQSEIRAADPQRTRILFNRLHDYRNRAVPLENVSWYKKVLRTAHVKMDNDPEVWNEVQRLIVEAAQERTP